jgi:hypothetical protein
VSNQPICVASQDQDATCHIDQTKRELLGMYLKPPHLLLFPDYRNPDGAWAHIGTHGRADVGAVHTLRWEHRGQSLS